MNLPLAFLLAIVQVESGGNDQAMGKAGEMGALQIGMMARADINLRRVADGRMPFAWDAALDREQAYQMAREYLSLYCTAQRLGREPTLFDAARIWNGGPLGYAKASTLEYAARVMAVYESLCAEAVAQ